MYILRYLLLFICCLGLSTPEYAFTQDPDTCDSVYESVLSVAGEVCDGLGRNKVCYASPTIMVEPQMLESTLAFESPGDQVLVSDIASMQLAAMDIQRRLWGIALFHLQAIVDDTSPGQLVTFVAFGGTRVELAPSTENASPMDMSDVAVPDAVQSFYLQTGIGSSQCLDVPTDGVLIQSERGKGKVYFQINDVDIELGSTIFVRSLPGDALYLYVLDGEVMVHVSDMSQTYYAGTLVEIPMSINSIPDGVPSVARMYDPSILQLLPLSLLVEAFELETIETMEANLMMAQGYVILPDDGNEDHVIRLKLSATRPWIETGLPLLAGQSVTFTATGSARSCTNDECDESYRQYVDPDGLLDNSCPDCIAVDMPEMSLVGRIGDGAPFSIGTNRTIAVAEDGVLYLAANDGVDAYDDNEGFYEVAIIID